MRIKSPARAPEFDVCDANGERVRLSDFRGRRVVLSFFRDAGCPFCNLRVYELTNEHALLKESGVEIIAFFRSTDEDVQRFVMQRPRPFVIVADPDMRVYQPYGIEHSWSALIRGMLLRMPRLLRAMSKGILPRMRGDQSLVPADFLIDEEGRLVRSYYGRDIGDHLPMREIYAFAAGLEPSLSALEGAAPLRLEGSGPPSPRHARKTETWQ